METKKVNVCVWAGCLTQRIFSANNHQSSGNPKTKCDDLYITSAKSVHMHVDTNPTEKYNNLFADSVIHMSPLIADWLSQETFSF